MSSVVITHRDDDTIIEETVVNPNHVKVLLNVQEVAVDGRVFDEVIEVTYDE